MAYKGTGPAGVGSGAEKQKAGQGAHAVPSIDQGTVNAPVLAGAPCRRRSLWLVVVPRCPHCTGMHSHRSGSHALFAGTAERVCPQTGRPYLLSVGGGRG